MVVSGRGNCVKQINDYSTGRKLHQKVAAVISDHSTPFPCSNPQQVVHTHILCYTHTVTHSVQCREHEVTLHLRHLQADYFTLHVPSFVFLIYLSIS